MSEIRVKKWQFWPIIWSKSSKFSGFLRSFLAAEVSLFGEMTLKMDNAGKSGGITIKLAKMAINGHFWPFQPFIWARDG